MKEKYHVGLIGLIFGFLFLITDFSKEIQLKCLFGLWGILVAVISYYEFREEIVESL